MRLWAVEAAGDIVERLTISEAPRATATGRILLAVETFPESHGVVAATVKLALRSGAEVLVVSVRERDGMPGFGWDVRPPGDTAEVVSQAIYELQRVGVPARGIIRRARSGRVADEIVYAAGRYHADAIVIGSSRRSWLGRLLYASVSPRVQRLSHIPVVAVATGGSAAASAQSASDA